MLSTLSSPTLSHSADITRIDIDIIITASSLYFHAAISRAS